MEKLSDEILAGLPAALKREYALYHNAVFSTMRSYNQEPTAANKRNLDVAMDALDELTGRILAGTGAAAEDPAVFATQQEVLAYLQRKGYKVAKSALSNHVRARLLRKKTDGFHRRDVDRYAELQLKQTASGLDAAETRTADLQERKLKAEIKKLEEQAKKAVLEREVMEGKLIARDEVELELAGRAVALEAGFDHLVYSRAAEMVDLVGGDQAKADRLIAVLLEAKNEWLNQYAGTEEFVVELKN